VEPVVGAYFLAMVTGQDSAWYRFGMGQGSHFTHGAAVFVFLSLKSRAEHKTARMTAVMKVSDIDQQAETACSLKSATNPFFRPNSGRPECRTFVP